MRGPFDVTAAKRAIRTAQRSAGRITEYERGEGADIADALVIGTEAIDEIGRLKLIIREMSEFVPLSVLNLTPALAAKISGGGIKTIGELIACSEQELKDRCFGDSQMSLQGIHYSLLCLGLGLRSTVEERTR